MGNMKRTKPINLIYLIPYPALIAIGIWYRSKIAPIAFFDGDSINYLIPPYIKALTNQWHKGERPMQYLQFIYLTLSKENGLKYTVITQQILTMLGALALTSAWFVFLRNMKKNRLLWHLAGYFMLAIFVSSPSLMYYEQLIGPESPCMFVMCILIFCLTVVFSNYVSVSTRQKFLGAAIFVNLYLINPMPKWVFAGLFLEAFLVYRAIKFAQLTAIQKRRLLLLPHLAFLVLVYIPEQYHKIDKASEDRTYIEFEQMAYTHFDLLVRNKSNFPLPAAQQDSLVKYFHEAANVEPGFLIGFSSDNLMWGPANNLITDFYKGDYDSIGHFYKTLNYELVTRYPIGLTKSILKQLYIFYVPNHYAHKKLCNYPNTRVIYRSTTSQLDFFDHMLSSKLEELHIKNPNLPAYLLSPRYALNIDKSDITYTEKSPIFFHDTFIFYRWFDHIYLLVMLLFFALLIYRGQFFKPNVVSLLYLLIFIYACTIAIVHTFDVDRFIVTIYPFNLVTTFMATAYIASAGLERLSQMLNPQIATEFLN
jgi:hypothetical protein